MRRSERWINSSSRTEQRAHCALGLARRWSLTVPCGRSRSESPPSSCSARDVWLRCRYSGKGGGSDTHTDTVKESELQHSLVKIAALVQQQPRPDLGLNSATAQSSLPAVRTPSSCSSVVRIQLIARRRHRGSYPSSRSPLIVACLCLPAPLVLACVCSEYLLDDPSIGEDFESFAEKNCAVFEEGEENKLEYM